MTLDTQSIIAIVALLLTCPPTGLLLYKLLRRHRYARAQREYFT
jgi:hypothetical protein